MSKTSSGPIPTVVNDATIDVAAQMIGEGKYKHEIKHFFRHIMKMDISIKSFEVLMSKGRARLAEMGNVDRAEMRAGNVVALRRMIASEFTDERTRVTCIRELNSMFGFGAQFTQDKSADQHAREVRQLADELDSLTEAEE